MPLILTDWTGNASVTWTGTTSVPGARCSMYASEAWVGASARMHWIAGPAELTNTVREAVSRMASWVGEVTVAVSAKAPSAANWNWASDGDGTPGAEPYDSTTSSTRLPKRSRASSTSVTCSSIAYTVRSGATATVSALGSAGTTTSRSSSTSAAPLTTHDTSYSPAAVAVTAVAEVVTPAPNGDTASACSNIATRLLKASNARQVTPTGAPAEDSRLASCVTTRTAGPAMISISAAEASIRSRLGAAHRAVAVPTRAAMTRPSASIANASGSR